MSMEKILLDGDWKLFGYNGDETQVFHPDDLVNIEIAGLDAQVPGNVELDLHRGNYPIPGLEPHPYWGKNVQQLRTLERYDWWYLKDFTLPGDSLPEGRIELVFEGLDTLATVWMNGEKVGESDNMLVPHFFDVTDHLVLPGENRLAVHLRSAAREARNYPYEPSMMSWEHRFEGLHIRKAPHVWGWDIMPRVVSAGIWRSVYLTHIPKDGFDWIYYWTASIQGDQALLGARFSVHTQLSDLDGLSIRFSGTCKDHQFTYEWPIEFTADGCMIPVPDARLWWPQGYGEANLYTLTARLCRGDTVLVEQTNQVGIRIIEVDRTKSAGRAWSAGAIHTSPGRYDRQPLDEAHFIIKVNHLPVMVKGTNWVPLDAYHSQDICRLARALEMVADLGCNMIRCWGGNVYESDDFFDWCDRNGVMVWQDFAFACNIYPQTDEFLARVHLEAEKIISRLRNHACLALWCGDNEVDMAYLSDGRDPGRNRLTREVLPLAVERFDPYREYLPSSPYVPDDLVGKTDAWQLTPEQHLWGPRGYFKSSFYTHHSAHFIGEIGYHGCPGVDSIRKFISPDSLWPPQNNSEWQAHAVYHWNHNAIDRDRIRLMLNQVKEFFALIPDDLETLAQSSQIIQAEAKKFFIESTRLRKWISSGILWWNLVDGWPQFSDAVVDYYFSRKLAYEYIRRVQVPVCLMIGESGDGKYLPLVLGNDSMEDRFVEYKVFDADDGSEVLSGEFLSPRNENWQVGRLRTFASEKRMYLIEWKIGDRQFGNHYLVGSPPFQFEGYLSWLDRIASLPRKISLTDLGLD